MAIDDGNTANTSLTPIMILTMNHSTKNYEELPTPLHLPVYCLTGGYRHSMQYLL